MSQIQVTTGLGLYSDIYFGQTIGTWKQYSHSHLHSIIWNWNNYFHRLSNEGTLSPIHHKMELQLRRSSIMLHVVPEITRPRNNNVGERQFAIGSITSSCWKPDLSKWNKNPLQATYHSSYDQLLNASDVF